MARKGSVLVSVDLPLTPEQINSLVSSVDGEGTQSSKVAAVALGLIEDITEGGYMLSGETVRRMEQASGSPLSQAELIDKFEAGLGRQGGSLVVTLPIDPVHEGPLADVARSNGLPSVEVLMRRDIEDLWDQGHFYNVIPQPRRVLMTESDYGELRAILGKDFENGTDLAAAVKQYVSENSGLFAGRE